MWRSLQTFYIRLNPNGAHQEQVQSGFQNQHMSGLQPRSQRTRDMVKHPRVDRGFAIPGILENAHQPTI